MNGHALFTDFTKTLLWKKVSFVLGLVVFVSLILAQPLRAYTVPTYEGLVNDYANIISDTTESQLEEQLQAVATSTDGAELAVVTITSLTEYPIETVAQAFFDTWEIGKASKDNGVLLLVAVDDREVRIQTGYGSEVVITDSVAGQIIRNDITPSFKQGDYDTGITQGVTKLLTYLQDPSLIPDTADAGDSSSDSSWDVGLVVFLLYVVFSLGISGASYAAAFIGRSKAWWPGGLVGFILGALIGQITGGIAFGLLGLVLDYILSKNYHTWKLEHKATEWGKTLGGFSSGSGSRSSSSSSGSSFSSFGGGSSGGGGASGSW